MPVQSDPSLAGYIARLKAAVVLAESWTRGDLTLDVVGSDGTYPSLAKLTKATQDTINLMLTNPTMLGKAGFIPPKGATSDRVGSPTKGVVRWNTDIDGLEFFGPKGWLALSPILLATYAGSIAQASGTNRLTNDTTAPLITEGFQLWTKAVTPKVIGSTMQIQFNAVVDNSQANEPVVLAFFRDNTYLGCAVSAVSGKANVPQGTLSALINDVTTSLVAVTYSCRVGNGTSGNWYVGRGQTATMGGTSKSHWKIDEVLA